MGARVNPARHGLIVLAAIAFAAAPPLAEDTPSLKDVLRNVAAYVESYGEKASIVVATERYEQTLTSKGRNESGHRTLLADFAIVKAEANHIWIGFRDVLEVDGVRVADREDRLVDVLTGSSGSIDEARRISDESARFNIGHVERNFNVPTTTLFFFSEENRERFKFKTRSRTAAEWEIAFRETRKPTLIRTLAGASVPCEGTVWVNPADGTVVRTLLHVTDFIERSNGVGNGLADIDVRYQFVAPLQMWLPATMHETYLAMSHPGSWSRIDAKAQYSNYREFQTSARIKEGS